MRIPVSPKIFFNGRFLAVGWSVGGAVSGRKPGLYYDLARRYPRAYRSWQAMRRRCNPSNKDWKYNPGRGIKICDRWLTVRLLFCRTRRHRAGRRLFEFLLSRILFGWRIHKSIKTIKTLIFFLNKPTILHCLGWNGNLFRFWLYLIVVAVQALLVLIFNGQTGPQSFQ
jgi:hypothetical protein